MKKILSIILFLLVVFCGPAHALEIVRQKNIATRIVFPIVDADGDTVTGAAGLDSEESHFADGSNPTSFADLTNEATEIGTTGVYYLSLTSGELNQDYVAVQIKTTTSGAKTQHILIRTIAGDPKATATVTTAGNSIDVASTGEVGLDFANIKNATGSTTLTNITVPTVTDVTNAVGVKTGTGANQLDVTSGRIKADTVYWNGSAVVTPDTAGYPKVTIKSGTGTGEVSLSSGTVTVGTNNDKTGYTASTVSDKTGYSLTQAFPTNFSSLAITVGGAVTAGTVSDKTGYRLSATGVDDIWDELTAGHMITGSYGKLLTDNIDAAISSRSTYAGGAVASVTGDVGGTINGLTTTAKIDVENAVWEATASSHNNSGTMGNKLNSAASAGDPWNTALPGAYGSGTAGYILGNNLNASVSSRSTLTAANVWQTDLSGYSTANQAGTLLKGAGSAGDPWSTAIPGAYGAGTAGYIIGNNLNATVSSRSSHSAADVWAVTTRLLTAGANISLAKGTGITGFNDLSAAQVNSEVDTALSDIKLDKLLNAASTLSSDVVLGSVIGQLLDNGTSWSFDRTTDSLEALRDRGDSAWITSTLAASDVWAYSTRVLTANTNLNDPSAAVIADAVWDEARSGHTTAGSFGQGVASVQGNVTGSVGSVTSGVTVTTNNDKTGYSLTQSFPTNFSSLSIDSNGRVDLSKWIGVTPNSLISGRVDANAQVVGDKAGYSLTQSFPANFSAFAITTGGAVTVGTNNDKTGYALTSAEEDAIVDKVWNESQSGHTSAGTFGKYLDAQVSGATAPSAATVASAVWEETSNHTTTSTMGKKLNDAALAGNPWDASGICSGLTAGQCLSFIKDSTDGDKEGLDYTGIEKTIRAQR